jgi:F-type H+-transporting ATPase subunit delta
MKGTKVATRYATALLELAIEHNNVDSILGDMNYLLAANAETRDFQLLLKSPIIHASKKIEILDVIFNQFETVTKSFVHLITNNGREGFLPEIASAFDKLVKEYKHIVPLTIVTASPLNDVTRKIILSKLEGKVDGTLEVTEEIDASLIGGFVVKMEGKQIDASVLNQMNNLKQRLTR